MISKHDEIEAKLDAQSVSIEAFTKWVVDNVPMERFLRVVGPDTYYENGLNVVRHRKSKRAEGGHELTVKRRKSEGSTRDRLEVDLHFEARTSQQDVQKFLESTGFAHTFTLWKEAHIFWATLGKELLATFVIYDVWLEDKPNEKRRFIEIEAEKGSPCTPETGKRHVRAQVIELQKAFGLAEPLNDSLYEIYSGRRYQTV